MEYNKRKQVFDILMLPIEAVKYSAEKVEICREGNVIKSTQTYYPYKKWNGKPLPISLDEDMSDFAIGFYEIIYDSIINVKSLIKNDKLSDDRFAGDTMNSFETIANLFPEAGNCKKRRTLPETWPLKLQQYKEQYHCLANFWILPKEIGRKIDEDNVLCKGSYTYGIKDYVDRFLIQLQKSNEYIKYMNYDNFSMFAEAQFIYGSYVYSDNSLYNFSADESNPYLLIDKIMDRIKIRATAIANSDYVERLWDYFDAYGLIEQE